MKSKIKSKKAIPFGEVVVIRELIANPETVKQLEQGIKSNNPKISNEDLQRQVYDLVMRDNFYNRVMDIVANSYEIEYDEEDKKARLAILEKNNPNLDPKVKQTIVHLNITKELIYQDLAKEWEINITDEHVKKTLDHYYQQTNQPIRDFLTKREKFEEVRDTIKEQLITERLLNAFKAEFQLEEFHKRMREQAAAQKPK